MRLCGHDCVVSGRYDPGSAGSSRYFYRLDPQDPLNFGIILSDLSINARWRGDPHAGLRIGTHTVHGGTYGTGTGQICNACVHAIGLCLAICRRSRKPPEKSAQGRSTGWGSGVYLGCNQARETERHRLTLFGSDSHRSALTVICYTLNHSTHHHNQCSLVLCHG